MKIAKVVPFVVGLMFGMQPAYAGSGLTGCTLQLKNVSLQKDGLIQFQQTNPNGVCGYASCQISGAQNWSAEVSRNALSMLMLAQTTGTPVYFEFTDASINTPSGRCSSMPLTWGIGAISMRLGGEL